MYLKGDYTPISLDEYAESAAYIIKNAPKNVIFHRITGDCPKELLVAPDWNKNKHEVIKRIEVFLK